MKAVRRICLIRDPSSATRAELAEHAETRLRECHTEELGRYEWAVSELVERAVMRQVELAEWREQHAPAQRQRGMDAHIDRRELELDLAAGVLEFQFRANA